MGSIKVKMRHICWETLPLDDSHRLSCCARQSSLAVVHPDGRRPFAAASQWQVFGVLPHRWKKLRG